ncbi:glutathione S-transferase [Geopyxis carbonaria]|nr:glutathione S-transferase [Geopyxis carbonaria]
MAGEADTKYQLIYWPGLPGRGEYIRLVLEEAGASYSDTPSGAPEVLSYIDPAFSDPPNPPPFAPPILKHGSTTLYQTPNILAYLGAQLKLVPSTPAGPYHVAELALVALDLSDETHNTHHPVGAGLYYDDQKAEAARASAQFRDSRIPKFFGYFERVLAGAGGEYLLGAQLTYADLVLFQVVDGLKFAFPKATARELEKCGKLAAHYESVKARPNIKAYLESERRQKYGNGIFRYYEELDL